MVLTLFDAGMVPVVEPPEFSLDVAFGADENRVKLTCPQEFAPKVGWYVCVEGTEYGGTVDEVVQDLEGGGCICRGRTWHGILAGKVLVPPSGSDYLEVSGRVDEVFESLFEKMGVRDLFEAAENDAEVSYTFERFCDGYTGICAMLKASNLRLAMSFGSGKVRVSAPPVAVRDDGVERVFESCKITQIGRRVNHLVCAGTGELAGRTVVHLYADSNGHVSRTQTLFGVDELAEFYDYSSADDEKLLDAGWKKLEKYQELGSIDASAVDDIDLSVGDMLRRGGVIAEITKKVVKCKGGAWSYDYETAATTA